MTDPLDIPILNDLAGQAEYLIQLPRFPGYKDDCKFQNWCDRNLLNMFDIIHEATVVDPHPNLLPLNRLYDYSFSPDEPSGSFCPRKMIGEPYMLYPTLQKILSLKEPASFEPPSEYELALVRQLDDPETLKFMLSGLFAGLKHLHDHGIIHMDPTDMNIFCTQNRWVISDYDISGVSGENREYNVGNDFFCPPEQGDDSVIMLPNMDVYTLGSVIRKIIVQITDPVDYGEKKAFNFYTPRNDDQTLAKYHENLPAVIAIAQARNTSVRYQTIQDFWNNLEPVLDDVVKRASA